jgi:hypothetical protein
MKKRLLVISLFICGGFSLSAQTHADKNMLKEEKANNAYQATRALIENGDFEFFADRLISSTGFSKSIVTTRNRIQITGETASIYLPYFGEVRANNPYQVDGGIKYEGPVEDYEVEFRDNKRKAIIQFSIDRGIEEHNFIMTVNRSGYTRVTVISSGRTSISYHGTTSAPDEASAD